MRRERETRSFGKLDATRTFSEHEAKWKSMAETRNLSWNYLPWPTLKPPRTIDDLTKAAISTYVLHPNHPSKKSDKERIKEQIRRWHPDRFNTVQLGKVPEDEREKVHEGAGIVARHLNELLSSAQGSETLFS